MLFLGSVSLLAAQSIEGIWEYRVLNTASGDYFGELKIERNGHSYRGEIISRDETYGVSFLVLENDSVVLNSDVEGFFATIRGRFLGDTFDGKVTVIGDTNVYDFDARRKGAKVDFQLIDSASQNPVPYATVEFKGGGLITNEDGEFQLSFSDEKQITLSAIGYETKTVVLKNAATNTQTLTLQPVQYSLPTVEIAAKGISAKKIVEAAIARLEQNYLQSSYNATLFFRYSSLTPSDSIRYQSESILNFYDAQGFQKRGWRKAASNRFAELQQARIVTGPEQEQLQLRELNNLFVFWAHEPVVTHDKPLSMQSTGGYQFRLLGIQKFGQNEVYEISFSCLKLKERFTGLPSLQSFSGKIFINTADYAVLRYEQDYVMDYAFKNKRTKKGWGGSERRILKSSRVEIFSKSDSGYALEYGKIRENHEIQMQQADGSTKVHKNVTIEEYQFLDVETKNVKPLTSNLFKLDQKTVYNPSFWESFNLISR